MSIQDRLAACRADIEKLKASIEAAKVRLANGSLSSVKGQRRALGKAPIKRKALQGHYNKVYAMDWAGDSERLLSASQDGKMILWNARTRLKLQAIPLKSNWVMACAFEQSENQLVASGGLDNVCSVYQVGADKAHVELQGHDGYVSCCRFVDPGHVLTASGDSTCMYWDVSRGEDVSSFTDHGGDVMTLAVHPQDRNVFVSGSCDTTAKVWDVRAGGRCVQTFVGHEGDINAIRFQSHGLAFATGSDDSTLKLFDLRSYARLNEMANESIVCGITSLDFSASGRVVFAGTDDCNCYGWDTLDEQAGRPVFTLLGHSNRVACVGVNRTGQAICTGSWDTELAIWA